MRYEGNRMNEIWGELMRYKGNKIKYKGNEWNIRGIEWMIYKGNRMNET